LAPGSVPAAEVCRVARRIETRTTGAAAELLRQAQAAIKAVTQVEYLILVQEEHSSHFHLWFFPWLPDVIQKYGEPSLAGIRGIMAEVSRGPISAEAWEELKKTIMRIKALIP
jgi:hypothetical protein